MKLELSVETQNVDVVRQGLEDLTDEFIKVGRLRLYNTARRIRSRIVRRPGKFRGKWTPKSIQQLRYIHAVLQREIIEVPYARTGAYARSWRVLKTDDGYILSGGGAWLPGTGMRIGAPYFAFVGGDEQGEGQSFIHQGRWAVAVRVYEEEIADLPEEIQGDLAVTARRLNYAWE